jgi:hypothetical protein
MSVSVLATPELLMTMTDIADLAEVQRPVVTKWRQRFADFPTPVGGDASRPQFPPDDVVAWLLGTRRISRDRAEQELPLFKLAALAARYPGGDPLEAVTALICLRYLAGEFTPVTAGEGDPVAAARRLAAELDQEDAVVLSEIRAIPREAGWAIRLVDDLVEASWTCRDAFEHVMKARRRLGAGGLTSATVAPELAELIAELSGAPERARRGGAVVVADPAAGPGDLVAAVAPMLAPDGTAEFTIAETDAKLARLVHRRLLVHGLQPGDIKVSVSADLPDGVADPDVIVTQIPYQPGETRDAVAVLNQVEDAALRLSPNRYGVILGPASVLTGELALDSAAWRARTELLKGFMVEAAIRLPGGLVPFRPGYETALWVVTQARDSRWRGRLLVADVSDRQLTHDVIRDLVEDVITWRRKGYQPGAHSRKYCRQIAIADLLEPPSPLLIHSRPDSPRGRVSDAASRVSQLIERGADLDRIGATATADRRHVPIEALAASDLHPRSETVGALVKGKRLTLHQGTRIKAEHITESGHHLIFGSDEVLGVQRPGRRVDRATFARGYPSAKLTRPGDVLVTMLPRPAAIVDVRGYAIAEFGIRILRIPDAEADLFSPRVLAALLFADGSGNRVNGAVRTSCPLEDQRLPRLEPEQIRGLDQFLAAIDARRDLARRELDKLGETRDAAIGGLISGTLTVTPTELTGQDE